MRINLIVVRRKMSNPLFTLEFLQIINDWQRFGWGEQKQQRAEDLKRACESLPLKFKTAPATCYRRLNLTGDKLLILGDTGFLPEETSSWTTDLDVAKKFTEIPKFGDKIANIFSHSPTPDSIVVSITSLFNDQDFLDAIDSKRSSITGYHEGIGYYADYEKEVVITTDSISIEDVNTWGGQSSFTPEMIERMFYEIFTSVNGVEPTTEQFDNMRKAIGDVKNGSWLKNQDAINRIRNKTQFHAKRLLNKRKA